MAGGYEVPRSGAEGLADQFRQIKRRQDNAAGSAPTESTVVGKGGLTIKDDGSVKVVDADGTTVCQIGAGAFTAYDPKTGSAIVMRAGRIWMWDDVVSNPEGYGLLYTDRGAGKNLTRWFPPHDAGVSSGLENSVTIRGTASDELGHVWIYSDDGITARVQDADGSLTGKMHLAASTIETDGEIHPYGWPTVSASANVVIDVVGGVPILKLSTSSIRWKQDVQDLDVDPDAVLRLRQRKWRDKSAVVELGDDAPWHIGYIAEEVAEEVPEFVIYDAEGQPSGLKYDRMGVGLLAVVKRQAEQIADLTARLEALESA